MPNLKVVSLNAGRMLQQQTREYLQNLGKSEALPDVLCLQDFPFRDLLLVEKLSHIIFGPMTNHLINGERAVVGIIIASRYLMTDIIHRTVWGDGKLKDLQGIDNNNARYLGAESDRLVEATEDRLVICAKIIKDGMEYEIATTHGMWVRNGVTNDVQRRSTSCLREILVGEASRRGGLVLAGDMNFPRGGEIYKMFTEELKDCMPPEIDNTLDHDHPLFRKGVRVVLDYFMTCPDANGVEKFKVSDVGVRFGVSDHGALLSTISKN